jgi:hypothetical protein
MVLVADLQTEAAGAESRRHAHSCQLRRRSCFLRLEGDGGVQAYDNNTICRHMKPFTCVVIFASQVGSPHGSQVGSLHGSQRLTSC